MIAVPCSMLRSVQAHDQRLPAITDLINGETSTYGDLSALATRFRRTLARLGMEAGDAVACEIGVGRNLTALLLACLESGLRLKIIQAGTAARLSKTAAEPVKLLVAVERTAFLGNRFRHLSIAELGQSAAAWSLPEPIDSPATATVSAELDGHAETMDAAALLRTVGNFSAVYPAAPGELLLSAPAPLTLEALCISTIIPLTLGLHTVLAGENPGAPEVAAALERAAWCEFSAPYLLELVRRGLVPAMPPTVRAVFCGSGRLAPADILRAETAFGRKLQRGYGTVQAGCWAICTPAPGSVYAASIRELRTPLRLIGAGAACTTGEIVLRPLVEDGPEQRTGDVGWLTPAGVLGVAGKLSEVSVRGGQAILLTDLDRLLAGHPFIRASRTFREHGAAPTEPVVSVCATDIGEDSVRDWLADQVGPALTPKRIVTLPAQPGATLPPVDILRAVATGRAGQSVVAALTARRFRRNPAYDEAGLAAAVDTALLSGQPLDFLMFWGCGPRRLAAAPDRAAVDALGDLLAAAETAAPVQARAHVICTDLHATNNGHAESHFLTYFSEIRALAGDLDVSFELESAVWRRGGLTKAAVSALEREPAFEERWQRFPLQARFVQQASRHSGMADKTAAARHYYATCLLEREVLKSLFKGSVFLTYNGPEFNECFPDLPTLYVYPGPRGPNDKPWFVDLGGPAGQPGAQVAAA